MADGSIRIETRLDTSTLKQQIKELNKELKNIQKEQAKVDAQADQAMAKYREDVEFDKQFPDQFSHRQDIDERHAKALEPIIAKQEELNQKEQKYLQMLDAAKSKLEEQSSVTAVSKTTAKTKELGEEAEKAGDKARVAIRKATKETNGFGNAITKGIKKIGKMTLAIFGIRGAYRAVRMAVSEYLATNEQLAGQIETMKSLFAQVLGPAIEWVVNLLIQAVSAVNAFVYALTGINFVARANEAALKKQAQAVDASKNGNSTASFDEQTKLQDNSGAGSSGKGVATLPDGTNIDMSFIDPLKEALKRFANDIAPFISTIKTFGSWLLDNFLIPLADWALNGVIPGFLNILGAAFLVLNDALWKIQPIALWIWDNFLEPIASWTGGVIVSVLNGIGNWIREHQDTLSSLVAILGGLYAAFVAIPKAITLIQGAFAVLATVLSSPITWITALIALFVTLYDECEGFRKGMDTAWNAIVEIFKSSVDFIKALFKGDWAGMDKAWAKIKTAGKDLLKGLWEGLKAGWEWIKEKLSGLWEKITTAFCKFFGIKSPSTLFAKYGKYLMQGLINGIKEVLSTVISTCKNVWEKIKSVFSSVGSWFKTKFANAGSNIASAFTGALSKIKSACNTIWSAIKGVFSNVTGWFKDKFSEAWTAVKNVFSTGGKIFDGIKDGISSTFKTIVNGLISGINKIIATPFNAINSMLNTIRSTSVLGIQPFKGLWSYNPLSVPQIPKLALGGIVNRPGRGVPAIIGEAGREAVLPLENHTEWMDVLADKINGGGNVTIPIYLDGKKMYTYMVDIGKRKAFAANGG